MITIKKLKSPPELVGATFTEEEKTKATLENKLLFISIMTDPVCNLACPDCYVGEKKKEYSSSTIGDRHPILTQARDLGAKTLRIAGEGEPLMDKGFFYLIDNAYYAGMHTFFFTNGTLINKNMANEIAEKKNLTPVLKFSGSPNIMEYLTGNKGKFARDNFEEHDGILIPAYLKNLLDAGINDGVKKGQSRLGIEFLLRKSNYGHIFDIFRWARRNNVVMYAEQNFESGCALSWKDYDTERVSDKDALALSHRLLEIDEKEFGFTWKPSLPYLVGGISESEKTGCKKFTYNLVVASNGEIYPCYGTHISLGNATLNKYRYDHNLSEFTTLKDAMNHPARKQLLENPIYNCLCRVFSKTAAQKKVTSTSDLMPEFDYACPNCEVKHEKGIIAKAQRYYKSLREKLR